MKVGAIIQAREGSKRLPGKALIDIVGKSALERVIERVRSAKLLDDVIVATTTNPEDDAIEKLCKQLNCNCFRGSENDVLDRVLKAAKKFKIEVIVEITADCPLIDYNHIDNLIDWHLVSSFDMTTNILERTFPRGYDIRIFNTTTLERVNAEVDNDKDREHVSTWMYLNPKGKKNYTVQNWTAPPEQHRPDLEVTLDTPEDLELLRFIFGFETQGYNVELTCKNVINLLDEYPFIYEKVKKVKRKDYFSEMKEVLKGAIKNVQSPNNRGGKSRVRSKPRKK